MHLFEDRPVVQSAMTMKNRHFADEFFAHQSGFEICVLTEHLYLELLDYAELINF
jgi:hypothetical protein